MSTSRDGGRPIAPAEGKLGVLLPGMGAVATTFIAGVEAIRKGLSRPIGSLTQMGTVRLGKRTKHLVKRLDAGDVAVIDHAGIDRIAGEELVASGCRHVINVAPSVSPRYARSPSPASRWCASRCR